MNSASDDLSEILKNGAAALSQDAEALRRAFHSKLGAADPIPSVERHKELAARVGKAAQLPSKEQAAFLEAAFTANDLREIDRIVKGLGVVSFSDDPIQEGIRSRLGEQLRALGQELARRQKKAAPKALDV